MFRVGLSVILVILFCIIIDYNFLNFIKNKYIITRLIIILSILAGLYVAFQLNKNKIREFFQIKRKINFNRIRLKFIMFVFIWVLCIVFSVCMSFFLNESIYHYFYLDSVLFSPIILIVFFYWIYFIDIRKDDPNDEYYTFIADLNTKKIKFGRYKIFLLNILVKIFYIPFIYGATFTVIYQILTYDNIFFNNLSFVNYLFLIGLSFDLCVALGGYLFSSSFFNTKTISIDTSWTGWFVCLICYPPLVIISTYFFNQADNYIWTDWLQTNSILYWLWAFLICLTWVLYWFATISFGFRFSNLSWRGLVSTGLYRYVKHPAYLSKNIYWWLHTVPFFGVMGLDILRNLLALSGVSLIYYLRAKTEERHLMQFDEYVQYCKWIDKNGLYAKIKKIIKIG